jgi:glutamate-5-semialdehyde dehydrogenase
MSEIKIKGSKARIAATQLALLSTKQKNIALKNMANSLRTAKKNILIANLKDLAAAKRNKLPEYYIDRLLLNDVRVLEIAKAIEDIIKLPDPIGEVLESFKPKNKLLIKKVRVPLGVIGIIYEARPNVTADAASLCIKTGNAVILRGGSDAIHSNKAIVTALQSALKKSKINSDAIQLIENTDRKLVSEFLTAKGLIDLVIPRGGNALIQRVVNEAKVPTIETGAGVCHVYVHEKADLKKAIPIILNAKTQRISVCNSAESLVIDQIVAAKFLPAITKALADKNVTMVGDAQAVKISKLVKPAKVSDWGTEYLDYKINIKTVKDIDGAIAHINKYNTKHTDVIMTEDKKAAQKFFHEVDASTVIQNASTRFTDGGEFGFGAEIGISTQKMHARGPMGLRELTSYKYLVYGKGQVRK